MIPLYWQTVRLGQSHPTDKTRIQIASSEPESITSKCNPVSILLISTLTSPVCVNLIALPQRLSKICFFGEYFCLSYCFDIKQASTDCDHDHRSSNKSIAWVCPSQEIYNITLADNRSNEFIDRVFAIYTGTNPNCCCPNKRKK